MIFRNQHPQHRNRRQKPPRRKGIVLFVVLVCLLVITIMVGTMLKGAIRARRQLRAERDLRQTELLLQAGIDRAFVQLNQETDYQGETWEVSVQNQSDKNDGRVVIQTTHDSETNPLQVHIVAEYPLGNKHSIRRSTTISIPSTTTSVQE